MKKPFSIDYREEIESGEYKVFLECGVEADILLWDAPGDYPIVCIAKKENAIPFRTDTNGKAYHLPNGSNYSDLVLVSSKQTEFENCLVEFFNNRMDMGNTPDPKDIEEHLHAYAQRLIAIAEKDLLQSGKVLSQEHHQSILETLSESYRKDVDDAFKCADKVQWRDGYDKALKDIVTALYPHEEIVSVEELLERVHSSTVEAYTKGLAEGKLIFQQEEFPDIYTYYEKWKNEYHGSPTKKECFNEGVSFGVKRLMSKLPKWKTELGFVSYTDDSISIENTNKDFNNPMPALRKGNRYILISDLEKLPKE